MGATGSAQKHLEYGMAARDHGEGGCKAYQCTPGSSYPMRQRSNSLGGICIAALVGILPTFSLSWLYLRSIQSTEDEELKEAGDNHSRVQVVAYCADVIMNSGVLPIRHA